MRSAEQLLPFSYVWKECSSRHRGHSQAIRPRVRPPCTTEEPEGVGTSAKDPKSPAISQMRRRIERLSHSQQDRGELTRGTSRKPEAAPTPQDLPPTGRHTVNTGAHGQHRHARPCGDRYSPGAEQARVTVTHSCGARAAAVRRAAPGRVRKPRAPRLRPRAAGASSFMPRRVRDNHTC